MPKKKKPDRVFSARTNSPVIAAFQKLVNEDDRFPWAQMVEQREMRFVYDMLSTAEARIDFIPSTAQGRWAAQILIKLRAAEKLWKADNDAKKKIKPAKSATSQRPQKPRKPMQPPHETLPWE